MIWGEVAADPWALASAAGKWLLYIGVLGAAGTQLFRLVFPTADEDLGRAGRRVQAALAVLGLGAGCLTYALRAAALTGEWSGLADGEMLRLLWQTPVGEALAYRLSGLALLIAATFRPRVGGPRGGGLMGGGFLGLVGAFLALWSFARVGHVLDQETAWAAFVLLAHLAGIALWIGALWPLYRLAGDGRNLGRCAEAAARFGRWAAVFVPLLLAAGVILAWLLLGSLGALVTTGYGLALVVKLCAVALLLGLAARNKFFVVPPLRSGAPGAAPRLRRTIALEGGLFLFILGTTAVLTSLLAPPA